MLFDFANVLVFTALGLGFVGVNLLIGKLLRPANPQTRKLSTYECGEPSTGSAWVNFNIRFYLVALIFIIFEVEIAFIFPVAAVFRRALELGGTLSAEHVIAMTKREILPLEKSEANRAAQDAIKRALDTRGVLNPRTIFT